jgi:hypothetical protein
MKQNLHDSNELFDSPWYGWEQMKYMLDKTLPVKNKKKFRELYLPYLVAAGFLVIFLLSSLVIQQDGHSSFFEKGTGRLSGHTNNGSELRIADASTVKMEKNNTNAAKASVYYTQNVHDKKEKGFSDIDNKLKPANESPFFLPLLHLYEIQNTRASSISAGQHISSRNVDGIIEMATVKLLTIDGDYSDSIAVGNKEGEHRQQSGWSLSAGLGMNTVIGQKQNLRPYPAAELRYHFTKGFFVSAGLGVGSPVTTQSHGTTKTVFLNDTTNNVYFYNDVKHYRHLSYVDVPLMAGVQVSKKIALQGGVQASVLLNGKSKTVKEPYDFQRMQASIFPGSLTAGPGGSTQTNYSVKTRKIDYRFITGLKFSLNKASFNVTYQYAPQALLKGNHISGNRNQLLSLGMQLKIK